MPNRYLAVLAAALLTLVSHGDLAQAQLRMSPEVLQQLSPEERQNVLRQLQSGVSETSDAPVRSSVSAAVVPRPVSAREKREIQGGGSDLPLFGYELFSGSGNAFQPSSEIQVPQNYALGPDDIIRVQLFGNQNETLNLSVTRDGAINFPKLGPIQVAGLKVDDARAVIERRVAKELIGVQTNITMGPLRGVQIFLLGDARQPGAYSVSGLATITNALTAGGGVATTGSLRKIELKRGGRVVQRLDLYDFLLRGDSSRDIRLQAGDAVFIPPVGPRIAVAGAVTRPAVYEINGAISVKGALDLAGGLAGNARSAQVILDRVGPDGQRQLRSLDLRDSSAMAMSLKGGDRIEIGAIYELADNPVTVMGHVRYEKSFPWNQQLTLSRLLLQAEVRPSEPGRELYPLLALVERTDAGTGLRTWHGFDLAAVRSGAFDQPVQPLDRVLVLTRADISYLLASEVRRALAGDIPRPQAEFAALEATANLINPEDGKGTEDELSSKPTDVQLRRASRSEVCPALLEVVKMADSARAINVRVLLEAQAATDEFRAQLATEADPSAVGQSSAGPCPEVFRAAPTALPYLLENSAGFAGEVRRPGLYPFASGTNVSRLIAIAGGETPEASQTELEFFNLGESASGGQPRFRKVSRDGIFAERAVTTAIYKFLPAVSLPQVGTVTISGEVRFPGRYTVARGERYSGLIARAGGVVEGAYVYGTVFTRESARKLEAIANRRAAADLRESLVNSATQGFAEKGGDGAASAAVLDLVRRLESAPTVGRVVIEADTAVLSDQPDADFLLEPGDQIYVPKRPFSVAVTGQVLNPGSLAFEANAKAGDYIKKAGGYANSAEKGQAFLVLPNGVARPLRQSFWSSNQEAIPPGSVIVVPRDIAPFTPLLLTERITSILSNLALSAAAIVTINR